MSDELIAPDDGNVDREEARAVARAFDARVRDDPRARRRERRAGHRLALEWLGIIAVTYLLVYGVRSTPLKIALLIPWSIYSSLALDNITHYANHWPLFEGRFKNAFFRMSGVLVMFNPLEIRAIHAAHHRAYSRRDNDEYPFDPSKRDAPFWGYLFKETLAGLRVLIPWRAMDEAVVTLGERRPAELREIRLVRWAFLGWFAVLAIADWRDTLFYFVPTVLLVGSFASLVMNLTDHIPGDPRHPFRLATYLEPSTARERMLSALNHQTCATHLTHHLFPGVHWVHLRDLQRRLAPIYARNGAPRSLIVNTTLCGNPIRMALLLREIGRRRFEMI